MDLIQIERLVRKGGAYFGESLWEYWPSNGNNELPERNISLHMARSFGEAGFASFAEYHTKGQTDRRGDYLAFHPQTNTLVVAESKRLYNKGQLRSLLDDVQGILDFRPLDTVSPSISKAKRYGALLATTWDRNIATWWSSQTIDNWPAGRDEFDAYLADKPGIDKLLQAANWGSIELQGFDQGEDAEATHHYLLYALFKAS